MKFRAFVGLTAIDVSLWGPAVDSQSVFTFAPVWVGVVQIFWPDLSADPVPKTAPATGAGAPTTLCAKSTGWLWSPSTPRTVPTAPSASVDAATRVAASR